MCSRLLARVHRDVAADRGHTRRGEAVSCVGEAHGHREIRDQRRVLWPDRGAPLRQRSHFLLVYVCESDPGRGVQRRLAEVARAHVRTEQRLHHTPHLRGRGLLLGLVDLHVGLQNLQGLAWVTLGAELGRDVGGRRPLAQLHEQYRALDPPAPHEICVPLVNAAALARRG